MNLLNNEISNDLIFVIFIVVVVGAVLWDMKRNGE
jgi:hypothetical protein